MKSFMTFFGCSAYTEDGPMYKVVVRVSVATA